MRPPQNAGEDEQDKALAEAKEKAASMRPPQNAGEDAGDWDAIRLQRSELQ